MIEFVEKDFKASIIPKNVKRKKNNVGEIKDINGIILRFYI